MRTRETTYGKVVLMNELSSSGKTTLQCALLCFRFFVLSIASVFPVRIYAQRLEVKPTSILIDQPAFIRVIGLEPQAHVNLRSSLVDGASHHWLAEAEFVADTAGVVDASRDAPIRGSYHTISAMGLIWSMRPVDHSVVLYQPPHDLEPQTIEVELLSGETAVATSRLTQLVLAEGVSRTPLTGLLHGTLFTPPGDGPHPALLVVGGSEGGTPERKAAWLASHGYAALALAYFHAPGLPPLLANIPLEYFGKALSWMMERREIDGKNIGVLGTSRGGELALLLGSLYPQIHEVVAYVPANVRVMACCGETVREESAWTLKGRPIASTLPRRGERTDPASEIAVEFIHGPVLLISGGDDGVWDSRGMAIAVMNRVKRAHFAFPAEHLSYDHAGHRVGLPEIIPTYTGEVRHPVSGQETRFGGTPEGDAASSADAGPKVLDFLLKSSSRKAADD